MTAVRFIALVVEHNMVSRRVSSVYKYSIVITSLIAFIIEISGLSDTRFPLLLHQLAKAG
jgi:hypothetical protein